MTTEALLLVERLRDFADNQDRDVRAAEADAMNEAADLIESLLAAAHGGDAVERVREALLKTAYQFGDHSLGAQRDKWHDPDKYPTALARAAIAALTENR